MKYIAIILILFSQVKAFAQNNMMNVNVSLPTIALLDVESNGAVNLSFQGLSEAGSGLGNTASDNTKWLNFTSAVGNGVTRKIVAQIQSGGTPSGYGIKLETGNYTGSGIGILGTSLGSIYLSNAPIPIISNIGGAYTGNSIGSGYNLKFSLDILNFGMLRAGSNTFTIVYTLMDN
jgi:hypothetical protein